MDRILISDVTMKQTGRHAGFTLSFREKLELVKLLDRLDVSVIEVCPNGNRTIDRLLIKSIASAVRDSVVAVPVSLDPETVAPVWDALKEARYPRMQVPVPVSAVQMEYLAGKKPAAMLETIGAQIRACRSLCPHVEFIAEDATRADPDFMRDALRTAIGAGADCVTVCDAAGAMLPDEFGAFITGLYEAVPELRDVTLGVSCTDELSMANSCMMAAIRAGAREIKASAYPANTADIESIARILAVKGADFGVEATVRMTQLRRILEQVSRLCSSGRSGSGASEEAAQEDAGDILTVHDDMDAVLRAAARLGYDLSEEDGPKVFEAFKRITAKKETISSRELDVIIASSAMQVPPTYKLESYVVNTGNTISSSAHLRILQEDRVLEGISLGDGPIDAAFRAIESIVGRHYELDDFQIQAITEGREAMGESVVKLRSEGKVYPGRGISTDIVGSSIRAYLSALNRIVYEENAD